MDITLNPKQSLAMNTTAKSIGYGGSVGSGKSFLNKIMAISVCLAVPKVQVLLLRQNYPQLRANYMVGEGSFPDLLREYVDAGIVTIRHTTLDIVFNNGAQISLRYLDSEASLNSLQGAQYQVIIADEGTQLKPEWIAYTRTRLRMGSLKVEDSFWSTRLPRWVVTTNPGNIGHEYIKKIFIDPGIPGQEFVDEHGISTIWIPAYITDNPYLDAEEYKKQIRATGDETLVAQLLDGNWDMMNNAFFGDAFKRDKNVVPDFIPPSEWGAGYRNYDPGYSSPFGYVLTFRVKGSNHVIAHNGKQLYFPNGSIVVYREWYGYDGKDMNVGLKWTHAEIAEVMRAKEEEWGLRGRVTAGRADWKIWDGELNVYSEYESRGLRFIKADKHKGSRSSGALKMRQLMFAAHQEPLENPALFFVDKCLHCIATIPTLPTDDTGNDVITDNVPDHLYDCLRYFVASKQQLIGTMKVQGI